jgi:alanyl-tRNA synthetase
MKSAEIRRAFLDYFEKRGHQVISSSSLVPAQDPTLLFTNAGMVQFKETFLGLEPRSYTRATTAQRCVRAGGKHNDLENVGYTARHHTFFEMLGNFSFGDYFKREAIQYAWTFLTEILHLPPEKLWVTVYEDDDEAARIWLDEMQVSPQRFSRCGEKDNFWAMGDTGPCGPCTEIFYDHGEHIPGGPPGSPEADGDRYIEIWNLVFMQYNRDKSGQLHPLPKPSVDTGMGLERIAAVVQGVHNNYHIDTFSYLIKAILQILPADTQIDVEHASLKVIADHIRACSFLVLDGVLPSNEGRGYVLRRIIRRAVRHGHHLSLPIPFFSSLVPALVDVMGDAYPELCVAQKEIERVLLQEELQFAKTLEQGLRLLNQEIQHLSSEIPGEIVFKLYDTYGFPVDLTADIARERGLSVDMQGFELSMQRQREMSQSASAFHEDYHATAELSSHLSCFKGYTQDESETEILAIFSPGQEVDSLTPGMKASIVLKETPFYAESGGQVGDQGRIFSLAGDAVFEVSDTQKMGQAIVHHGQLSSGLLTPGQIVHAHIDRDRRQAIRLNHTATHLVHAALKSILGQHVQQKGSLVDAARARFDFSNQSALSAQQLSDVEALVNAKIRENVEVSTEEMSMQTANQSGAVALFGEKYGESVRVLTMGDFSKELCGGTHASRTGDLGLFKVVAEYGVANGVRRLEFVTGDYALDWMNQQLGTLQRVADALKTTTTDALSKLSQVLTETKEKERLLADMQYQILAQSSAALVDEFLSIGAARVLVKQCEGATPSSLRGLLDQLKSRVNDAIIVLIAVQQDKMHVVAGVSKSLIGRVPPASRFVQHLCGKGGGREDMAQGGGAVPADLPVKIQEIFDMLKTQIS